MQKLALKFLVIAFAITTFISCNNDNDAPATPLLCNPGYSGVNCNVAFNSEYTGSGTVTENCTASGVAGPYQVTFTKSTTNPFQFTIVGLWEIPTIPVNCVVNSTNSNQFTASRQPSINGFDIEITSGNLNGSTITYTYRIYATGATTVTDQC